MNHQLQDLASPSSLPSSKHRAPQPKSRIYLGALFSLHMTVLGLLYSLSKHNWHWFLVGTSFALVVWTLFELFNLYKAVKVERHEIWGAYYPNEITEKQTVVNILFMVVAFYAVVNVFRIFMGEGSVLQWFAMTNVVMAAGPGILWMRRGSRKGSAVGLAIVILLGTINTFIPNGMFVLSLPDVFDHPWFYITGVIFTFIAASN